MSAGNGLNNIDLSLTIDDFTLHGTHLLSVDKDCDYNLCKRNYRSEFDWFWTYCVGDDLTTNRGITFGDNMSKVFEKYGEEELFDYDEDNDILVKRSLKHKNDIGDFKTLNGDEKYCEYCMWDKNISYIHQNIRFYFGKDNEVKLIAYYNFVDEDEKEDEELNRIYSIEVRALTDIYIEDGGNNRENLNREQQKILYKDGLEVFEAFKIMVTHQPQYIMKKLYSTPFSILLGNFAGFCNRVYNKPIEALKLYYLVIQFRYYSHNKDSDNESTISIIKKFIPQIKKNNRINIPNEILVDNLQKALANSLASDKKYNNDKLERNISYKFGIKKWNIGENEYVYLIFKAYDEEGNLLPFVFETENFARLHNNYLPLRIDENEFSEENDDKGDILIVKKGKDKFDKLEDEHKNYYDKIVNNDLINTYENIDLFVNANLIYEVQPKILLIVKDIIDEIKKDLLLVKAGKMSANTFVEKNSRPEILEKMDYPTILENFGYVDISTYFGNIIQDIFIHRLEGEYGIDYIMDLIDTFYELMDLYLI